MPAIPGSTTIGFIGLGVMGRSMAGHLLRAGYELHIHNRTKSKCDELISAGAIWHAGVAELSPLCDVIITIVGFPADVEGLYLGNDGIIDNAKPGAVLIDMTTSEPKLSVEIHNKAKQRNIASIDAPVSGGDVGAREARLSIMVGGDESAYHEVLPLFEIMGKTIVLQGPAGSGQHCKACNQISIAAGMLGVCEAVAYAGRSGLDPSTVLESISGGAAGSWSLSNLAPRMIADNFDPGFYVKHFIKDMQIAAESSRDLGLDTPGLALALSMYRKLAELGGEDDGTQALFKLYNKE
jgi:3-hydroxyisobutyrate dehydrogenase